MALGSLFLRLRKGTKAPENTDTHPPEPIWGPLGLSIAGRDAAMALAADALAQGHVPEARGHWARARTADSATIEAWTLAAQSHSEHEELDEALALLMEAAAKFPSNSKPLHDMADVAERSGNWAAAERLWRDYIAIDDNKAWAYLSLANAIRQQGRLADADTVLAEAQWRLPESDEIAAEVARTRKEETSDPAISSVSTEENEAAPELAATAATTALPEERELMMQFESLGGTGHGCEFGIFQRSFGAEPLGLLRWADLDPGQLCAALETGLEGVGELGNTDIFVPPDSDPPEYWTKDHRYHMAMRCFVLARDVSADKMADLVTKRLRYLRNKLLDDLAAGQKILVYKNMKRNLTDAELGRLYTACRRYGENTLLYIRYESQAHPNGTVQYAWPGLLIGYIDHFSHSADTDEFLGSATESLLAICRKAHGIWTGAQRPDENVPIPTVPTPTRETAATEEAVRERLETARTERDSGQTEAARAILATTWADFPGHVEVAVANGWLEHLSGNWPEAAQWWMLIREIAPQHIVGYVNGARVAMATGRPDEAEQLLLLAVERFPHSQETLSEHMTAALERRDWPEAARRAMLLAEEHPDHLPGWLGAARALREQSRSLEAEALLDRAIERFGPHLQLLTDRCWLPHLLGDWHEAERRWAALREQFPGVPNGWVNGGVACRELGRFDEAETLLAHAVAARLDERIALAECAWVAAKRGDWRTAARRWHALRETYPDHPQAWQNEATALAAAGDLVMASEVAHHAITQLPSGTAIPPDLAQLAETYGAAG
jgi:tetratricopeptide (TPR) repeat protein